MIHDSQILVKNYGQKSIQDLLVAYDVNVVEPGLEVRTPWT